MAINLFDQFTKWGNKINGLVAGVSNQTRQGVPDNDSKSYSDISDDSNLSITENQIKTGKGFFGDDKKIGFILGIDPKDRKGKFEIGSSPSKILRYDGVDFTLIGGNLSGGSIYVPNSTSPLFSVDTSGNVIAASLKRKDFHWYTVFESIDGYTVSGSNPPTLSANGITMTTGVSSGDNSIITKVSTYFTGFSWDKKKSLIICIAVDNNFTGAAQTFWFGSGAMATSNGRKIGFKITNTTLYGVMGNGTNEESVSLSVSFITNTVKLRVDYDPSTGCNFYSDETLLGSLSTYKPSGATSSSRIFDFNLTTNDNAAKTAIIGYYDFWQAL